MSSGNDPVSVSCCDEDCVTILDQTSDDPIVLFVAGPPGPVGSGTKSGVVPGASFSGSPKKFAIVFSTPYTDDQYSILITGGASRSFTYESKTADGFTINANASTAFTNDVSWFSVKAGS